MSVIFTPRHGMNNPIAKNCPIPHSPAVRFLGKCSLIERIGGNELVTKDPDRRGWYACGFVIVRMQSTRGDAHRAAGGGCPIDATDDGTDFHQQPAVLHTGSVIAA